MKYRRRRILRLDDALNATSCPLVACPVRPVRHWYREDTAPQGRGARRGGRNRRAIGPALPSVLNALGRAHGNAGRTSRRRRKSVNARFCDVGSAGTSLRTRIHRAAFALPVREDSGLDLRVRNARLLDVDAAFLTLRSTPIDEERGAREQKLNPRAITSAFLQAEKGDPITLPSGPPDKEANYRTRYEAAFISPTRSFAHRIRSSLDATGSSTDPISEVP